MVYIHHARKAMNSHANMFYQDVNILIANAVLSAQLFRGKIA